MANGITLDDWKHLQLKEIGKIISGGTPSTAVSEYWNGDINWISPADLTGYKNKYINKGAKSITEQGLKNSSARMIPKGSVLFSSRAPIGYVAIAGDELATNQGFKSVIPNDTIEKEYLYYFLKASKQRAEEVASGTTFKEISLSKFSELVIPVPPKQTQQAIVSKIEELFSELDKGIENLRLAQQQLKTYRQSVLKWAFEGKLTNELTVPRIGIEPLSMVAEEQDEYGGKLPKGWKRVFITDIVEKDKHALKAGPFGSSLKKEFYVAAGYKIYGQEQVISGDPFYGDYYISKGKYEELFSCRIKPSDVLISLVGTVGKVLLLPENCEPGIINPRLIKVSLNTKIYLPKFFKYYFESSTVKGYYSGETRGTTMDVLNLGIIKTIPFPLCSIDEQHKVIEEIESRFSVADKMEESINQSLQQAEALRQSILKKAFEGKLI